MRMPWVPRVQSRGYVAGVKFVRKVREVERVGSSVWEIGGKRWSSKALFIRERVGRPVSWFCVDTASVFTWIFV